MKFLFSENCNFFCCNPGISVIFVKKLPESIEKILKLAIEQLSELPLSIKLHGILISPSPFKLTVMSFALIIGDSLSITVTVWVDDVTFPKVSVTVYVINVIPIGNWRGASLVCELIPQSSLIITVPRSTPDAKQEPRSDDTLIFWSWIVIVGLVLSVKVTNCVALTVFPYVSLAIHVIVVVPVGKEAGALFE